MRRSFLTILLLIASTSAGRADCADDFRAINTRRADASRFELRAEAQVIDAQGNIRRRISSSSQFDLSNGVRMKTTGLATQPDIVIVHDRGWRRDKGGWTPMPQAQLDEALKNLSANSYFHDAGISDVECSGDDVFEGEKRLAFQFNQNVNGVAMKVVAYFDVYSRLPAASVAVADVKDMKIRIVNRISMSSTIAIETPE